jgi:dipeptidyl aminopeptidase/acylaminoacyl peptidase
MNTHPMISPYGSWKSPITSDLIVSEYIGLVDVLVDGLDVYWIETRPKEGGRYVVIRRSPTGKTEDVIHDPFSARTLVHEYGGGAAIVADGVLYFSNFADQRVYRRDPGAPPQAISRPGFRYADGVLNRNRDRLICVREDHTDPAKGVVNAVVDVPLSGTGDERVLVSGNDFYSAPRLSPDGDRLAWTTWNHPSMPWIGTELWIGDLSADGAVQDKIQIAGGPDESIFQPQWSPLGVLFFVSDRNEWWNLFRYDVNGVSAVFPADAEFGQPQWNFGMATFGFQSEHEIICTYIRKGVARLAVLDLDRKSLDPFELPFTEMSAVRVNSRVAVFLAGGPREPTSVVQLDLSTRKFEVLATSSRVAQNPFLRDFFSTPEPIEYPTADGLRAYGLFYPPANPEFHAPEGDLPPLIVMTHGGPTAAASSTLDLRIQYWTSRGVAIVNVDYGGSTGYGRTYRNRLRGQWGILDVDDCVNAAKFLIEQKKVDPGRLAIRGASAGGYTTLSALTFRRVFQIGASYYGIGDLEALAKDTHKFESHYLEWLVGKYPEERDLYLKRSPINFTQNISVPIIFFQGDEDKIVPPTQAQGMVNAIRSKGLPFGYILFRGEQHGFRMADNIKRALDAELDFYSTLLFRVGLQF